MQSFTEWLVDQYAPNTATAYTKRVRGFAEWFATERGVPFTPDELTATDVRVWRTSHPHLSAATVALTIEALRAYVRYGQAQNIITHNPLEHTRAPHARALAPKWLDRKQQAALLRAVERTILLADVGTQRHWLSVRNGTMMVMLLNTGLRISELCALLVGDVQSGERSGFITVRGKRDTVRRVPLNVETRRALQEWHATRPAAFPLSRDSFLFITARGVAVCPADAHAAVQAAAKQAGIHCSPHTLRHTCAKNLIDAGVRESEVAALLGHARLDTTRRYTFPSEHDLAKAVDKLSG